MRTWLLLDSHYLLHRAFFAHSSLSHDGEGTGALFGFFRDILALRDRFGSKRLVFCFDRGPGLRELAYPFYKAHRPGRSPGGHLDSEMFEQEWTDFKKQIEKVRKRKLYECGFRNVLWQRGYEGDDIIASFVQNTLKEEEQAIIVSNDHDLWQLLQQNVMWFNPVKKELISVKQFQETWGMEPELWVLVKAIAGCSTDNVAGVVGVGEKTAAKYIRGDLNPNSKTYKAIREQEREWKKNIPLVKLPFPGCIEFETEKDEVTPESWKSVMRQFGIRTLTW